MSRVTGLKSDLPKYDDDANIETKNWKSLLKMAKTNKIQYPNIDNDILKDHFNPNTNIISTDNLFASYRICKNCGKPVLLNSIMSHIQDNCPGLNGGSTSNSSSSTLLDGETASKVLPGTNSGYNGNSQNISSSSTTISNSGKSIGGMKNGNINRYDASGSTNISGKKRPPPIPGQSSPKKKRNMNDKNKKRRNIKQRNPTDKHLIDFDKQCGVSLPEGGYCARSLTCKSHSMGAKRSVEGRTKTFDELLANYHREHQTKIGAAAEKRAKQLELQKIQKAQLKEQKEQKKLLQQKQRQIQKQTRGKDKGANSTRTKSSTGGRGNNSKTDNSSMPSLTPEEETTQVLNGVSRSFPLPLETTVLSSTRLRTKYIRMREMFASAFSVKPGFSSPGYGAIHSRVGCLDIDRTTDYKFRIRVPQPTNPVSNPTNLTPQQLQKLQQHRMLQAQMQAKQQQQQQQLQQSQVQVQMQGTDKIPGAPMVPQGMNNKPLMPAQNQMANKTPHENGSQDKGLTLQEIQLQQQKLRQQQLQQQKFEAAAFHLANASKLMQNTSNSGSPAAINVGNIEQDDNSSQTSKQTPQGGSPNGNRVNVGLGNQVNNYGGRVN
ncbi:hypothetical protein C6P45_002350 [Maudiozyma exigua]|uniref:SCA7 domain-containing protein n=1 Tax=Maudiozyma exigua TaxID=34358 RepID=A0A9P6WCP3_MAUEX|nr:hypothetical protein C6P45_002350 [Kazachstania exigua]